MDDPLFDPWGDDAPATRSSPKWRAPEGAPPTPPNATRAPSTEVGASRSARLIGTAGFLRSMAAPRLEAVAIRLHLARHDAVLEDHLEGSPPALRLRLRPWRAPFSEGPDRGWDTLELSLETGHGGQEDHVVVRRWCELPDEAVREERLAASRFGAPWLDARVLDFLASALDGL